MVDKREEALRVAKRWGRKKGTICTVGSRLKDRKVGAAAVWGKEAHPHARAGNTYHPIHKEADWTGQQYHLGRKQEDYGAELYAIRQAIQLFDDRGEREQRYTIFADSASTIDTRIASDRTGPGQRLAVEAIEACSRLMNRGNSITIQWTSAHLGAEGNEMADLYARGAAESELYAVDRAFMHEASFAYMTRLTTEAKISGTNSWIANHIRRRRAISRQGVESSDRSFGTSARPLPALSGHAATGAFLCPRLGSPLAHHQHSLVSIFFIPLKWDPVTA